ncbi:MAG: glycosyltransferase family 39 protein [Acetobacteraceae bacterium]
MSWTPGFFTLPPGDRDESRFAQATKQMLETGDFVRIQNGTEARNRKPIGIHWLQAPFAAAARAAGVAAANPIWPYRLPSALGALIAVLGTFALGEALVGRRAALLAGLMLGGSVILTTETHIAKTDAALLGSVVLAMGVLARAYRAPAMVGGGQAALFWLAMGAGVLLKGPVGPMVVALTALTLSVADRRARWLLALRPGWGVPLMLAAVLPWFVAIGAATGGRFFTDAVGGDLGRKLSSGDDAHWGPPGLHLLLLPVLLFPASAALPGALARAWRERTAPATRFLIAWVVPSWLVFEAVPTKLPHYTLPLLPAVCLLAASWMLDPARRPMARLAAGLPVLVALVLAAVLVALPVAMDEPVWLGLPGAVVAVVSAAVAAQVWWRPGLGAECRAVLRGLAVVPVLYWGVLQLELPALRELWLAPRVVAAVPPGRLGAVGFAEPSLMFLAGTGTRWLRPDEAASALVRGEVGSLVVGDLDLTAVMADASRLGLTVEVTAAVPGFNYSRGRFVTLSILRDAKPR